MSDYQTPGVYVEEKSVLASSVAGVSTAIPAFIGYTQKAGKGDLFNKPTRITTLKEYEDLFGKAANEEIKVTVSGETVVSVELPDTVKNMYYSMQMFFNNGGESCYIVALNSGDAIAEKTRFEDAVDALKLEDEPTLIVLVDGLNLTPVTTDPETGLKTYPYYSICQRVLAQCALMKDRFGIFDVIDADTVDIDMKSFREGIGDEDLKYGAAYYPYLNTTINYQFSDSSVKVVEGTTEKALSEYDAKTTIYNNVIQALRGCYLTLPPSAAVAGVYAGVDRDRGVWKAPANVGLASVSGPRRKLTENDNGLLNIDAASGKSINAIRSFTGKGILVWGARTLAGNDNEWRYVPVRRLFNYIEESIEKATSFAVFEPNNAMTWLKLRSMVESFLDNLWRQGALAGGKAEDAYFVQVGLGTTMTSQDILEGRLIIKIGIAAVRPAEFIILEFSHKLQTA